MTAARMGVHRFGIRFGEAGVALQSCLDKYRMSHGSARPDGVFFCSLGTAIITTVTTCRIQCPSLPSYINKEGASSEVLLPHSTDQEIACDTMHLGDVLLDRRLLGRWYAWLGRRCRQATCLEWGWRTFVNSLAVYSGMLRDGARLIPCGSPGGIEEGKVGIGLGVTVQLVDLVSSTALLCLGRYPGKNYQQRVW